MKKFTVLLWMALTAVMSMTARAAEELTDVSFVPDPSEVQKSLSKITVSFSDANWGIYGKVDVAGITLSRRDSPEVLYALPDPAVDYSNLYLEFAYKGDSEPVTVTADGVYTLHIPAGAVTAMSTGIPCAEISVDFTVSSNTVTEMDVYELTPAPGIVDEISTIAVAFPQSGGLDWFHNDLFGTGSFSGVTLSLKENPVVKYTAVKKAFDRNATVTFAFVKEGGSDEEVITAPGTYLLTIPAGTFLKDFSTLKNSEISAEYVIESSGLEVPEEFAGMVSVPADGAKVGQLNTLSLTFPNMADGLDYPIADIASVTIETPDGSTFHGINPRLGGTSYNQLQLNFAPEGATTVNEVKTFTEAGLYTVTIPAGVLKVYGKDVANTEIKMSFTIDPMLNFTYTMSPDPATVHDSFGDIVVTCGSSMTSLALNSDCTQPATISLGEKSYNMTAVATDNTTVTLSVPAEAEAEAGEWTVNIPAGFFTGENKDGVTVSNQVAIVTTYIIKEARRFDFTVTPAAGATIEFFKNVTLEFSGNDLKTVGIDTEAGNPVITADNGTQYDLTGRISGRYAIFSMEGGVGLADGNYTVTIPEGYVYTVDRENLTARVGAVTTGFTIVKKEAEDYTDGIMFLNEGWFGHDTGSINFLSNNGEWIYDAFLRNNPDHHLGITSQYGHCFGDKVYVVSKQSEGDAPADGGVFTVIDAASLQFVGQINNLPDTESQARAFCAWDNHKGYLSTKDHIYVVDLDNLEVLSVVPGTDIYTSFDSNGEMLRYGKYVYAIRQSTGVDAIDPDTDDVTKIPAELAEAFAVTPDGSLYVATRDESNEFVKISTADLSIVERIDIEEDRAKIANIWSTWRKAPLATDITANTVYYVTQKTADENPAGVRTVARYDFDTREFTENFITLPGEADGESTDWILYGEGVSVDPRSGMILLTAVEAGYGAHYSHTRVFVADPATGKILPEKTYVLEDGYWFPAMTMYPDFDAPVINTTEVNLAVQPAEFTLDVAAMTTLAVGNKHLVDYTVTSLNEEVCTVAETETPGVFEVSVLEPEGRYTLQITASYQGKSSMAELSAAMSAIGDVAVDNIPVDVYNLQGICVLRNATLDDINNLPAGIYIAGGKKYVVK